MSAERFLADRMLGKLSKLLRMVGVDAEYQRTGTAAEVLARARAEGRILLTRDQRLAVQLRPEEHVFVDSNYPFHQARQVIRERGLSVAGSFSRCVEDNGLLSSVPLDEIRDRIPEFVQSTQREFVRCERCARVYWPGTHLSGMREIIASLTEAPLLADTQDEPTDVGVLEPLLDLHGALDVLLLDHRLAILRCDFPRAQQSFKRFRALLERHIQDEERWVLPRYAGEVPVGGFVRGSAPEIFAAEHAKLLELSERLARWVEESSARQLAPASDRAGTLALAILDREKVLVDLLEHHDRREREYLYPALERSLTEAEKRHLLDALLAAEPRADKEDPTWA